MTANLDTASTTDSRAPASEDTSGEERLSLTCRSERVRACADAPQTAISTEALFGSKREVLLSHEGTLYRLRITSKDKLILTK